MIRRLGGALLLGAALVAVLPAACSDEHRRLVSSTCLLNSECDTGLVCTFGRCHTPCETSKDCARSERCVQADGANVCQLESEADCSTKTPCTLPLVCATDRQCRNGCEGKDDCLPDQVCAAGGYCADAVEVDERGRLVGGSGDAGAGGAPGSGGAASTGGVDSGTAAGGSSGTGGDAGTPRDSGVADAGPEDCANGVDDNGNGAIDCADSRCADHACADAVPTGFTGPVVAWFGAGAAPECPAAFGTSLVTGTAGLTCDPAACSCSCDAASGQSCSGTGTAYWNSTTTCPLGNGAGQSVSSACQAPNVGNPNRASVVFAAATPAGGSCTPRKAGASLPSPVWATNGVVCGGAFLQGGCPGGALCTPPVPDDFERCVYREGDVDCPPAVFTEKRVLYSGNTDDRACSCSCSAATGGSCSQTLQLFGNSNCTGAPAASVNAAYCSSVSGVQGFRFANNVSAVGSCNAVKSQTGGCAPAGPTTVCCKE